MSHVGLVRKKNEDHFLYCTLHKTMRVGGTNLPDREILELPSQRLASFGMVADGVGGKGGGDVASQAAVEALARYVTTTMESFYTGDATDEAEFEDALREAAQLGHQAILKRAEEGNTAGMATTLTMIVASWPHLYLLHVGDSKCYLFRQSSLLQLTRDQTLAQDLVDSGALPADRRVQSPFNHMLSSSLGGQTTLPVVSKHHLEPGDIVLLCTDGLTKHVPEERITARLGGLVSSEGTCRDLIDDAIQDGGTDNITVILLRAVVGA